MLDYPPTKGQLRTQISVMVQNPSFPLQPSRWQSIPTRNRSSAGSREGCWCGAVEKELLPITARYALTRSRVIAEPGPNATEACRGSNVLIKLAPNFLTALSNYSINQGLQTDHTLPLLDHPCPFRVVS